MGTREITPAQPPQGCWKSLQDCIDDLCIEQSKGPSKIDWKSRTAEDADLRNIEENLNPYVSGDYHDVVSRIIGSMRHRNTLWASDNVFADAWFNKNSSPLNQAQFRQNVAKKYLEDHPDDCQPPPILQKKYATKPVQLPLFPELDKFSAIFDLDFPWWIPAAGLTIASATTSVQRAATPLVNTAIKLVSTVSNVCLGSMAVFAVSLRYLDAEYEKTPIL